MKSKQSNPMEAIKHLFGKQIVCGSMLSLHALLLAGNCQGSGMVLQPYKAGTEGQQIDALTQTQKQAASAGVLAQNQTQPKTQTQTQTQPKKPQAKTEARDALAQAQKQTETAWTSSLARMQQNQDNLIRIVGETLNTLLNNAFLSKQTEVLSVTGQSAGKSTSVTGQSAGQSTHSNSNNSVPTQDPSKTQQLSASIVDVPPPPPSQKTSSENSIRKSEFQPPSKTPFLIELEEAVEKKRLRLELNAKLNKDDPPKTEDQKTEDQKTEDMPLVSSIA
ncbi:MAG TPA: hypothetical protein VK133_01450 [Amoebophilaceae bacterium]|nr:hypothetical protein [Amoebophilaceae bacterium]